MMTRDQYERYLNRFNAGDSTAFDDYLVADLEVINGALTLHGVQGMKDHYEQRIWPHFDETVNIVHFVSDDNGLAVQMWTHFIAQHDCDDTIFGPVKKGDTFDYRGIALYNFAEDGRFSRIVISYNSFVNTKVTGEVVDMGMPH